jgi:hypothetical protein
MGFIARATRAIGYVASALGLGIVTFGLLAIADPQGTQLANDSSPFGPPPSLTQLLLNVSVGAALLALGAWLVARKSRV